MSLAEMCFHSFFESGMAGLGLITVKAIPETDEDQALADFTAKAPFGSVTRKEVVRNDVKIDPRVCPYSGVLSSSA
jgi:hypothetical protein